MSHRVFPGSRAVEGAFTLALRERALYGCIEPCARIFGVLILARTWRLGRLYVRTSLVGRQGGKGRSEGLNVALSVEHIQAVETLLIGRAKLGSGGACLSRTASWRPHRF